MLMNVHSFFSWGNIAIAQVPTGLFFAFDRSYIEFIFKEIKMKGFSEFLTESGVFFFLCSTHAGASYEGT